MRALYSDTLNPQQKVCGSSPEDAILAKRNGVRYAVGGEVSERPGRDTPFGVGVLKQSEGELDLDTLRKWANEHIVHDLLESALDESK